MNGDRQSDFSHGASGTQGETKSPLDKASAMAHDLREEAAGLAGDVTRKVREQASQLNEKARDAASGAGDKLLGAIEEQKNVGADFVSGLAGAVRRAAGEFEGQIPQAGDYIRRAAEQMDSASDALRRRDFGELVQGVQDLARRQPTAFLGATVLAGFAVVRFLKSSSPASGGGRGSYQSENERHLAGAASRLPHEQGM